jgi:SAM-dependent methyltransferase
MSNQEGLYLPVSDSLHEENRVQHVSQGHSFKDCMAPHASSQRSRAGSHAPSTSLNHPIVSADLERKIRTVIDKYWGGKLYMKIPHPAFDAWPAAYGYERWEIIKPHLNPAGGTALDIGAHFGAFSHLLEDHGYDVTAVEILEDHAEIMQAIREMAGKHFKVLCQSIFDLDQTNFDLVIALNVFHHFLKQKGDYQNLIAFLNRLNCETFIFQGHDPDEPQMNGAYRNFHPEEFCEFVREHSGMAHFECIGQWGARKIFKISHRNRQSRSIQNSACLPHANETPEPRCGEQAALALPKPHEWSVTQEFLNHEHRQIFERTKDIPGWQAIGDSYRLFEMGYRAGDVILEIGVYGGRGAVVELLGALANPHRKSPPQYFGVDSDKQAILRTIPTLEKFGLSQYAMLYHGDLAGFCREFSIRPSMVFVDGDHSYQGVRKDLELLGTFLAPGTPVLCHDFTNPENETGQLGVRQAVTEFIKAGKAEFGGIFGCSAFLIMGSNAQGQRSEPWPQDEWEIRQATLRAQYQ